MNNRDLGFLDGDGPNRLDNLRNNHPEHKILYPDDNHVGTWKNKNNGRLNVTADKIIRGLDKEIPY